MVTPTLGSVAAFVGIVAAVVAVIVAFAFVAYRPDGARAGTKATFGLVAILVVTGMLARTGLLLGIHGTPWLLLYFAGSIGVMVGLACSRFGRRIAERVPLAAIVALQAFRLPLEFVLHAWWEQGVIPVQMTYEGHNFDIVTGIAAPVVALTIAFGLGGRRVAWCFNVLGIALLIAVSVIAILSSPVPMRAYADDPVLELAFHFPTTWIVPMGLGAAWFGHVVLTRRLLRK